MCRSKSLLLLWLALSIALICVSWFIYGYSIIYSKEWSVGKEMKPYHVVPYILGTLMVLSTAGLKFYSKEELDNIGFTTTDSGEQYRVPPLVECTETRIMALRIILITILLLTEWFLTLLWAFVDWFAPGIDIVLGVSLVCGQFPFVVALITRCKQKYDHYNMIMEQARAAEQTKIEDDNLC